MSRARIEKNRSTGGTSSNTTNYTNREDDDTYRSMGINNNTSSSSSSSSSTPSSSSGNNNIFTINRDERWRSNGQRTGSVRLVAVGGGIVAIATSDNQIYLWNSLNDDPVELIEIKGSKPENSKVYSLAVDPTGRHILICTVSAGSGTAYYCNWILNNSGSSSSNKPVARELTGLRGYIIETVAWNPASQNTATAVSGTTVNTTTKKNLPNEERTGTILLGTVNGRIVSCSIEDKKERNVTRLFDTNSGSGEILPITSLRWDSWGTSDTNTQHFILAVTGKPLRYYEFSGGPSIETVFANAANKSQLFHEIRGGPTETKISPDLYITYASTNPNKPETVTFLTGVGLYTGRVQYNASGGSGTIADPKLLPYPSFSTSTTKSLNPSNDISSTNYNSNSSSASIMVTPVPIGLAVTPFHYLLLYRQRIVAVSRISHGIIFEQAFGEERLGTMRGVVIDAPGRLLSSTYIFSDRNIFRIGISDESRDVWKLYLARNDFESARKYAKNDAVRAKKVNEAEAEHMFATGRAQEAAVAFARTTKPFEETCLRFISGGYRDALQSYLSLVLGDLKTRPLITAAVTTTSGKSSKNKELANIPEKDRTNAPQRTVLCTWLLEMYLDRLNVLHATSLIHNGSEDDEYNTVASQLRNFLREHTSEIDRNTALSLMAGYGRTAELLFYCRLIGEWGRIVSHHISRGEWSDAVEAIKEATASDSSFGGQNSEIPVGDINSQQELWYRYSSVLVSVLPAETVDGWKECPDLDPSRLIPTLVRYELVRSSSLNSSINTSISTPVARSIDINNTNTSISEASVSKAGIAATIDVALLYLEWIIDEGIIGRHQRDARSRAIHNLLLSLYAAQPIEDPLLQYLDDCLSDLSPAPPAGSALGSGGYLSPVMTHLLNEKDKEEHPHDDHHNNNDSSDTPPFDLQFGLRTCLENNRKRACVRIYCAMGLYVEAVDLALTVDVELAKDAANRPPRDETTLRKRLWTRIAVHIVSHGGGAAGAIEVMEQSACLRIEDVLAYFPGTTTIGDFKTEVTESLREADLAIAGLRTEMRNYTETAELIRTDIKALRNRCGAVRVGQKCDVCRDPVLSRHFYLFPCGHAFHNDCLLADMMKHLNSSQRRRVGELTQLVQRMQTLLSAVADGGASVLTTLGVTAELSSLGIAPEARATAADIKMTLTSRSEEMQGELDRYVAGECLYCGDVMIRSIADPLGTDYAAESDRLNEGIIASDEDEWAI